MGRHAPQTLYEYHLCNFEETKAQKTGVQPPGRVISKTKKKMVLDISLINTHHYKVCIKGKVVQS